MQDEQYWHSAVYAYDVRTRTDFVNHCGFFCLITLRSGALGPLHTLQFGSEGSQRIPTMHAKSWNRLRTFYFVPESYAGPYCGVNPHYGQGGGKPHFTVYTCERHNIKMRVQTLDLNGHPIL